MLRSLAVLLPGNARRDMRALWLHRNLATFQGHSIGRWDGDTLVVDIVAILPPR